MVMTPSKMVSLGTQAPDFSLPDTVSGELMNLSELRSAKGTLIMFICNHCPFVKHVEAQLAKIGHDYIPKGISLVAISSNDVQNYPDDSPQKMKELAESVGFSFPYLYDESQEVAKAYQAACTPDFYLFNADLKLAYRGQLDDSRPSNGMPVTGADLRAAMDALVAGEQVNSEQKPSVGCNIKWK